MSDENITKSIRIPTELASIIEEQAKLEDRSFSYMVVKTLKRWAEKLEEKEAA